MSLRMQELVYSTQKHGFVAGRAYANPRFFTTARQNISKVFIVGDAGGKAREIRAAYEAQGVKVEHVDPVAVKPAVGLPATAEAEAPATLTPGADTDLRANVFIPENWQSLSYNAKPNEDISMRGLASMVSDAPITNKASAVAAITAELERRKALGLAAAPVEQPAPVAETVEGETEVVAAPAETLAEPTDGAAAETPAPEGERLNLGYEPATAEAEAAPAEAAVEEAAEVEQG